MHETRALAVAAKVGKARGRSNLLGIGSALPRSGGLESPFCSNMARRFLTWLILAAVGSGRADKCSRCCESLEQEAPAAQVGRGRLERKMEHGCRCRRGQRVERRRGGSLAREETVSRVWWALAGLVRPPEGSAVGTFLLACELAAGAVGGQGKKRRDGERHAAELLERLRKAVSIYCRPRRKVYVSEHGVGPFLLFLGPSTSLPDGEWSPGTGRWGQKGGTGEVRVGPSWRR